jgi:hypothetical protein
MNLSLIVEIAAGIILAKIVIWFWADVIALYLWHGSRLQREADRRKEL